MRKNSIELWLYIAILLLALFIRFFQLGDLPLNEAEASSALQAFQISRGATVPLNAQAGYVLLTSVLFTFLRDSEFWARFLPALVGGAMTLLPLLFRRQLGSLPVVLLAGFIAIDPGLVILSRTADGSILGIAFLLFCIGFLINNRPVLAGIFGGLSLVGGITIWFGLTALLIGVVLFMVARKRSGDTDEAFTVSLWQNDRTWWGKLLIAVAVTVLLTFSLFFRYPSGLGGVFSGLAAYGEGWSFLAGQSPLSGWLQLQALSLKTALLSLLFYESLPLVLGIAALIMAFQKRDGLIFALATAALSVLFILILYPARGFAVFPWLSLALGAMLCKYLLADYSMEDVQPLPFIGLLSMILILVVFSAVNLKGVFTGATTDIEGNQLRLASILGSLLIILLGSGLVIWGWTVTTATKAIFGAFFVLLFAINIQTVWYTVTAANHQRQEVWLTSPFTDADLLTQTAAEYQNWNIGSGNQSTVWIAGVDSQALEWALRSAEKLEKTQALPTSRDPEMMITSSTQPLAVQDEYAGQDFVLAQQPVWDGLDAWGWMRWFFLRQTPHVDNSIILWVRVDQFPGYDTNELPQSN